MPYWKCPIQTCPWRHTETAAPDLDAVEAAVTAHVAAHAHTDFLEQLVPMDEPASPDHPAVLIRRAAVQLVEAAQQMTGGPGTTRPLTFLRSVRGLRLLLHDLHVAAVVYARARGCTWEQIGQVLSITPADAEARYSSSLPSSTSTGATQSAGAEP